MAAGKVGALPSEPPPDLPPNRDQAKPLQATSSPCPMRMRSVRSGLYHQDYHVVLKSESYDLIYAPGALQTGA